MDDNEIEVTIDTAEAADDSPESGIEALRQQMATVEEARKKAEAERDEMRQAREMDRAAREEAERRAHAATAEAQRGNQNANEARYDSIVNALTAAQSDLNNAKAALKDAAAEGDYEKVAELTGDIGEMAARVKEFKDGKAHIERQRAAGNTGYEAPATTNDPRERYIQTMPPRTAAWLRNHDRFFTDTSFQKLVQGAAQMAQGKGIAAESDQYFQFIEEQAGLREAAAPQAAAAPPTPTTVATATAPRQSPMPAAPAGGSTMSASRTSTNSGTTVTLSAQEREMARMLGISETAYAKQKLQLLSEGSIGTGH